MEENQKFSLFKELFHPELFNKISDEKFGFGVSVVNATFMPQKTTYAALHQCYTPHAVDTLPYKLLESRSGEIAVERLLAGNRGHYSPTEKATITFSLDGFNHGTIQQLTRSRIGVSFAVQSFRYTSEHILLAAEGKLDYEKVAYLRPPGKYHDREQSYEYELKTRIEDMSVCAYLIKHVAKRLKEGMPPEQARGMLGFDYRQHCLMTVNTRSLMGILDRRGKKDAQIEIQILSKLLLEKFNQWQPEIADYYVKNRWCKAILAP